MAHVKIILTCPGPFPYVFHVEHSQRSAEDLLRFGAKELGLEVREEQVKAFLIYLRELKAWNRTINLTALKTDRAIVVRHFLDSLLPLACLVFQPHQSILDVGSGAGFPGLPLKIMRPDLRVTLVESTGKKVAFLRHIVGSLHLDHVKIQHARLEDYATSVEAQAQFDTVLTRAVRINALTTLIGRVLKRHGRLILFRSTVLDEAKIGLDLGAFSIEQQHRYSLPFMTQGGVLIVLGLAANVA